MRKPEPEEILKVLRICSIPAGIGAFMLTVLAVHDMHISQGVGLYFAINFGLSQEKKTICDLLVDMATTMAFLAMILVPVQIRRRRQISGTFVGQALPHTKKAGKTVTGSCFRLLATLLAFLPTLSLAYLVHVPDSGESFMLREALVKGDILKALTEYGAEFLPETMILIVFLIMAGYAEYAAFAPKDGSASGGIPGKYKPQKHAGSIIFFLALGAGMLLFPGLSNLLYFLLQYTLILLCFGHWERLIEEKRELEPWSYILSGGFLLRGIYLLLTLMSTCRL